jgi:hypothetical protein
MGKYISSLVVFLAVASVIAISVTQNVTVTVLSGNESIHIYSPQNKVYNSQKIPLNITSDYNESRIRYSDNGVLKLLCRNCWEYGYFKKQTKTFNEGQHNLTIETDFTKINNSVSFFIDSIKPKIFGTWPLKKSFVDNKTEFSIKYTEDNLVKAVLHYGNRTIEKTDCESGRIKACNFTNLILETGNLEYWFEVFDYSGSVNSSKINVNVDLIEPEIIINSPENSSYNKKVLFNITSNKNVYLEYKDVKKSAWNKLCNSCDSYSGLKGFPKGNYSIIVRATDKLRNIDEKTANFSVK